MINRCWNWIMYLNIFGLKYSSLSHTSPLANWEFPCLTLMLVKPELKAWCENSPSKPENILYHALFWCDCQERQIWESPFGQRRGMWETTVGREQREPKEIVCSVNWPYATDVVSAVWFETWPWLHSDEGSHPLHHKKFPTSTVNRTRDLRGGRHTLFHCATPPPLHVCLVWSWRSLLYLHGLMESPVHVYYSVPKARPPSRSRMGRMRVPLF